MSWIDFEQKTHLSKWPSDLKINGTQENLTFSGPVFHGLSCGVFLSVASVSFKNHPLDGWNFSTANQVLLFMVFEANTRSKKEDTTWKAMKSLVRKCYIFMCTINFEVTWLF